jgi:hypothetical protein
MKPGCRGSEERFDTPGLAERIRLSRLIDRVDHALHKLLAETRLV